MNLLGKRNPQVYGTTTMEQIIVEIQRQWLGTHFVYFQSNHEGDLIDRIQGLAEEGGCTGIVLNAGGYAHTSVALRDAVEYAKEQGLTIVNTHLTNIRTREAFRHQDLLEDVCSKTIIGHGKEGYKEAVEYITRAAH